MYNTNNDIILKQHNKVTEARYEMSALEKNIVYMLMAQLRDTDPVGKEYEISIVGLQNKMKAIGQEISLDEIKEATHSLINRIYSFDEPDTGYQIDLTIFASVTYKNNSDFFSIELSRTIRPYLFDLKFDFTSYKLDFALSLTSKYAKRIYEMLSQHKETGIFYITVLELKERLKLIDPSTKTEKFKAWSSFAKHVLEVAKREISKKTDLSFSYILKKTGAKYTAIEFQIFKQNKEAAQQNSQTQLELGL
jgi:plasmid replication initiation protein